MERKTEGRAAERIDVLAWLDSLYATTADGAVTNRKWPEAQAARAAVAELVEADREYDAAMRSEADTDGMLRRESARARRAAALAPFQTGGAK